jgi:hypothetical protein
MRGRSTATRTDGGRARHDRDREPFRKVHLRVEDVPEAPVAMDVHFTRARGLALRRGR